MKTINISSIQSTPLAEIQHFFDTFSLPSALHQISTLFNDATSSGGWRSTNPYNTVLFCLQLEKKLSKAAFELQENPIESIAEASRVKPGADGPDLCKTKHYMSNHHLATPFTEFPRHLSAAEYADPAMALGRYCRQRSKKDWKILYNRLLECALSNSRLQDFDNGEGLFEIRSELLKLVEAGHLIYVRDNG